MRYLTTLAIAVGMAGFSPQSEAFGGGLTARTATACPSVNDVVPTGVDDIPATRIRARHVSCKFARRLPAKVVLNARYGGINPSEYSKKALGIAPWKCRLGGYGERTACRNGRRKVSWYLGDAR